MKIRTPEVSIIIVHYKVKEELFECLASICNTKTKISYQIIVVDNDEKPVIHAGLKEKFPNVLYISGHGNNGYGGGNNIGAKVALGDYLFFLNPDTKFLNDVLSELVSFLKNNKKSGIVAPMLFHKNNTPFQQGTEILTPIRGIFSLSFINKLFPSNPISRRYWLLKWDKKKTREVGVVPGTALMIPKGIFEKIGKFDEKLFLYFEESDLCKRVWDSGYKVIIAREAKLYHAWERSTKQLPDTKRLKIFSNSKYYYFKKHFGILSAILVQGITGVNRYHIFLFFVLILGGFLRFYKISELMPFFGDQGWFYLSARDLLTKGEIPLVGITSSHTWLHQGPLFTYILAISLWLSRFNPLGGAYLAISIGLVSIWLMYYVGKNVFSKNVGIIASLLLAISPLAIVHSRISYHTTPIPLFTTLFFYAIYKWVNGDARFFPFVIFVLAVLYNFELATVILGFSVLAIFLFGLYRKKAWVGNLKNKKIILYSFFGFVIPMLPILIYDIKNGFFQTFIFAGWIFYKIFTSAATLFISNISSSSDILSILSFLYIKNQKLLFAGSGIVAGLIFLISMSHLLYTIYVHYGQKKYSIGSIVLGVLFFTQFLGFFAAKTISEAYLPVFFSFVIFIVALFIDRFIEKKETIYITFCILLVIIFVNPYSLIVNNYYMGEGGYGFTFFERKKIAQDIIREAKGREYTLAGKGSGSEFASFTMNYAYLTWWMGHGPANTREKLIFLIEETPVGIKLNTK